MTIHTNAKVSDLKAGDTDVSAMITLEDGARVRVNSYERVILAVGIAANTENLGLEESGVKVENGSIVIDEYCRTTSGYIFTQSAMWLGHQHWHTRPVMKPSSALKRSLGQADVHPLDKNNIPGCTYCTPQVASVGLTEKAALDAGYELKIGRFPYQANGKAIALGETEGMIKTIFDAKTGEMLGAHMIGTEATELIQGYTIGKTLETTEAELMHTVFPHPTLVRDDA